MIAIDAYYGGQQQLLERIRETGTEAAIFVEGLYALEFGTRVLVRVTTRGMPGDVTLEGTACPDDSHDSIAHRGATRVLVAPAHRERFEFLRDWAQGVVRPVRARDDRVPIARTPCMIALTTPVARREAATLLEVSDHGACIACRHPLSSGSTLTLELSVFDVTEHLAATVVWAHGGLAGLRLHRESSLERSVWARVVSDHRRAFAWRVLTPARGMEATAPAASGGSGGRYAVVDREAIERRRTARTTRPTNPTMPMIPSNRVTATSLPSNRMTATSPERETVGVGSAYPPRRATLECARILPPEARADVDDSRRLQGGRTDATPSNRVPA